MKLCDHTDMNLEALTKSTCDVDDVVCMKLVNMTKIVYEDIEI